MILTAYPKNRRCIGALGSMTVALKAARALSSHGIFAEVISLTANETKRGCAFGVSFDCNDVDQVRWVLKSSGIQVTQYLQREGTL